MRKANSLVLAGSISLVVSGAAFADGLGFSARASTLGAGAELTAGLTPSLNVRVGFDQYSGSSSSTKDGIDYNTDAKLQSTHALLDWHPFQGTFRLTGGYLFSNNEVDMTASGTGQVVTIGDVSNVLLTSKDSLTGTVKLNSGAYLGMGWGNAGQKGWGFTADLGVVLMGSPDVSLKASDSVRAQLGPNADAELAKEENTLQNDLNEYKHYPVVAIGISYGF